MNQKELKENIETILLKRVDDLYAAVSELELYSDIIEKSALDAEINKLYQERIRLLDTIQNVNDVDFNKTNYYMTLSADLCKTDKPILKKLYENTDINVAYSLAVNDYMKNNPNQVVEDFSIICEIKLDHLYLDITAPIVQYIQIVDIDDLEN